MNKKLSGGPAAVIEIGSSAVRMRVSQLKHGEIEMLDSLEYPVFFGHEVFTTDASALKACANSPLSSQNSQRRWRATTAKTCAWSPPP